MNEYLSEKELFFIHREIETCKNILKERGFIPIYIAVYGSQNYNLSTPHSDVDLKAIVAPKFSDICCGKSDTSATIELPSGGLCDVKTPNKMFECWKKQNVNFIELLFTDWYWVDNSYKDIVESLRERREEIARFNEKAAVNCMLGMAKEKQHALCKAYPSQIEIIERWGYAPKQLHHIKRLCCMLKRYVAREESYENFLRFEDIEREALIREKVEKLYGSPESAIDVAEHWIEDMEEIRRVYVEESSLRDCNEEVGNFLDEVKIEMIRRALKAELLKEC